jgi:hypothetical protein
MKFDIGGFQNPPQKFKFYENLTRIFLFLLEKLYAFMAIPQFFIELKNLFLKKTLYRKSKYKFHLQQFFSENFGLYEIMQALMRFQSNNGYAKAPKRYVTGTLLVLFRIITEVRCDPRVH